ncbi:uncharacterized protein LOC6538952 [Drosophila yakuba]|uniref:Drosophila melanogaster n=1 Tax=Drosophila yakuba TaxID=7245 RepID=B4PMN3_DROYA|nr:uncharacterized protein LOC6538952 [Drosophila yakuba]EDW99167.1 uncharacterized protein Dyak_GE23349 [Drosophila yakuba]
MKPTIALKLFPILLVHEALASQHSSGSSSWDFTLESVPTKVLILCSVVVITVTWVGCAFFMANRHQKAVQYLQDQLDELWLLQAKPSVWPHAPFIPSSREQNPPEYIPPRDPEEQEELDIAARERAEKARAFLEARNSKDKK